MNNLKKDVPKKPEFKIPKEEQTSFKKPTSSKIEQNPSQIVENTSKKNPEQEEEKIQKVDLHDMPKPNQLKATNDEAERIHGML